MEGILMYAAMNLNGELIYARELERGYSLDNQWFCPDCRQEVIVKKSKKQKYFFSHLNVCHSEDLDRVIINTETDSHMRTKEIFYNALQDTELTIQIEYPIDSINQIADIYVEDYLKQNRMVIEYQHTPISAKLIHQRHKKYLSFSNRSIWLIDYHLSENIKQNFTWFQTMLHYDRQEGFYWQTIDTTREEIVFLKSLPLIFQLEKITYIEEKVNVKDFVRHCQPSQNKQAKKIIINKRNYRKKPLREIKRLINNPQYRSQIMILYKEGLILSEIPSWILTDNWRILITKSPSWLVLSWVYAIINKFAGSFSNHDFMDQLQSCYHIKMAESPLIEDSLYPLLAEKLLDLFQHKGIIQSISSDQWVMIVTNNKL